MSITLITLTYFCPPLRKRNGGQKWVKERNSPPCVAANLNSRCHWGPVRGSGWLQTVVVFCVFFFMKMHEMLSVGDRTGLPNPSCGWKIVRNCCKKLRTRARAPRKAWAITAAVVTAAAVRHFCEGNRNSFLEIYFKFWYHFSLFLPL